MGNVPPHPVRKGRRPSTWLVLGLVAALAVGGLTSALVTGAVEPVGAELTAPTAPSTPAAEATATNDPATPATTGSAPAGDLTALAVLSALEVKGRAPQTGYDRDEFGQRWLDVDRNGCDTRNDILARDLTDLTRSGPCTVTGGILPDPFTGRTVPFVRGQDTSAQVQIDHVVALSDAWQKGAQQLTAQQRASFANDPLNLLAVDGAANAQKGDGDAATWLPRNTAFRCTYVARQVSVKAAYGLWVTQAEHDAISRVLAACPDEPALTSSLAATPPTMGTRAPAPAVTYESCAAALAAGAAPLHAGEPGYSTALDRDGDGVACEQ